jgi:hypothetical protein
MLQIREALTSPIFDLLCDNVVEETVYSEVSPLCIFLGCTDFLLHS